MFRKTLKIIQLVLQFILKLIAFIFKTSKLIILFIIIIFIFYASKVDAQVIPHGSFVYFYSGSLTNEDDCSRYFSDFDSAFLHRLKESNYKIPDRFYYSAEYLDSRNNVFNPVAGNKKCQKNFISESVNLTRVELQVLSRDKITNSAGSFISPSGQGYSFMTIYAFYAPITDFYSSCNSNSEMLYAFQQGKGYFSFCKNQQLRYANQTCLLKYQNVVDVYYEKTRTLDQSTELTSYIDDYIDPSKTAMCRLSHKLKYKEDRNCVLKQYFYNGLHYDQGSVFNGTITPVDLVNYQVDNCSYILSPSYEPPTPDWNPDDSIPTLGEVGSDFDSTVDYDGDGQVGTDGDLAWCIEYEFGCRVCLDGNCDAWPPGGSKGGGGSGGNPTDPTDPVDCEVNPNHSSCTTDPVDPTDPTDPVDCDLNPDDPSCTTDPVDPTDPIDCDKNPTDPSCPTKPVEPPKYGGPCVDTDSYTDANGSLVVGISCGVKSWYTSSYPKGFKGAFEDHIKEITKANSPLFSVAKFFDWKHGTNGSAPTFDLNFQFSFADLGHHKIDFSNMFGFNFWIIGKAFILIFFAFAAFRVSFGG